VASLPEHGHRLSGTPALLVVAIEGVQNPGRAVEKQMEAIRLAFELTGDLSNLDLKLPT
jgi:hypothetical protein